MRGIKTFTRCDHDHLSCLSLINSDSTSIRSYFSYCNYRSVCSNLSFVDCVVFTVDALEKAVDLTEEVDDICFEEL